MPPSRFSLRYNELSGICGATRRCAMRLRNLVGKGFNKPILALAGRRLHGFIEIIICARVGYDTSEDAAIAQSSAHPLNGDAHGVASTPRIEHDRVDDRHTVAALRAHLAADITEL